MDPASFASCAPVLSWRSSSVSTVSSSEQPEDFLAQPHQDDVDCHAVKPRRNADSPRKVQSCETLQKRFLGQVFGFRRVGSHPQA